MHMFCNTQVASFSSTLVSSDFLRCSCIIRFLQWLLLPASSTVLYFLNQLVQFKAPLCSSLPELIFKVLSFFSFLSFMLCTFAQRRTTLLCIVFASSKPWLRVRACCVSVKCVYYCCVCVLPASAFFSTTCSWSAAGSLLRSIAWPKQII